MNRDWLIYLGIAALLIGTTGGAIYMGARGLRNNNPGNIRHSASNWQGTAGAQTDTSFVQFISPEYGIRALTKLLQNYQSRYGLNTVRDIINRWAPPVENDTGAYVAYVARMTNVDPDEVIDINEKMTPIVTAIIRHENGSNPYPDELIQKGIGLA